MYEVKKIGRHWLIRPLGGQFKRLRLPADAVTVELTDNFLIVDDIVFEIKSKGDDVFVEKVQDISVGDEILSDEKDPSIVQEVQNIYLETKDTGEQLSSREFQNSIEFDKTDFLERQEAISLEVGTPKQFPVTIIDETENNTNNLACSINISEECSVNQMIDSSSVSNDSQSTMSEDRLNENLTYCNKEKFLNASLHFSTENDEENFISKDLNEVAGRKVLNATESDYRKNDSLESGQTEETSNIEIVKGIDKDGRKSSTSNDIQNRKHGKSRTTTVERYEKKTEKINFKAFLLPNNVIVKVYEANILHVPVDCIVSASNGKLQHGGGVASVIARAAGKALVCEGDEIIKKHGELRKGSAVTTTAGNLPYRCVIHAVDAIWRDYIPYADSDVKMCEDALFSAIFNALHKAEENGSKSVAIPSVSSAIFCVPEQLCVCMYVRATIQYCKNAGKSSLAEIHFVDVNAEMVKLIQKEFQTVVCDKKKSKYNRSDYVKQQKRRETSIE